MKSLKLLLRFLTVGGLVLLLLVPLLMIRGTVDDRKQYRSQAMERVSQSMAGPQQVVGPLRIVPYKEVRITDEVGSNGKTIKKTETLTGYLYQTPRNLKAEGGMKPDTRRIGLYDVRVFEWSGAVEASFDPLPVPVAEGRTYGEPYLVIGLADVRGLVGTPDFKLDGKPLLLESGSRDLASQMTGMHAALPQAAGEALPAGLLKANLRLAGTQSLGIAPLGDSNHINLGSTWPHPLFGGSFLPNSRTIRNDGFNANWEVSSLASSAQSQLKRILSDGEGSLTQRSLGSGYDMEGKALLMSETSGDAQIDSVQVSLVDPTDVYTQVDRASKYGILFVVLTFVGFFLFETLRQLPIHPIQYALVGLALAIFFLLLLSLSEHIAFGLAYLAAALACIGLIGYYVGHVLRSRTRGMGFAAMLGLLYAALYGLLMSEDNALVLGAGLLFVVLAAIMVATRKVDWYQVGARIGAPSAPTSL